MVTIFCLRVLPVYQIMAAYTSAAGGVEGIGGDGAAKGSYQTGFDNGGQGHG